MFGQYVWPRVDTWPPIDSPGIPFFITQYLSTNNIVMSAAVPRNACIERTYPGTPITWYTRGDFVYVKGVKGIVLGELYDRYVSLEKNDGTHTIDVHRNDGTMFVNEAVLVEDPRVGDVVSLYTMNEYGPTIVSNMEVIGIGSGVPVQILSTNKIIYVQDPAHILPVHGQSNTTKKATKVPEPYQLTAPYLVHPNSRLRRMLVVHPTGSGKTVVITNIINSWAAHLIRISRIEAMRRKQVPTTLHALLKYARYANTTNKIIVIAPSLELIRNIDREVMSCRGLIPSLLSHDEPALVKHLLQYSGSADNFGVAPALYAKQVSERAERFLRSIYRGYQYVTAGNMVPFYEKNGVFVHHPKHGGPTKDGDRLTKTDELFSPPSHGTRSYETFNPFDGAVVVMDEYHNLTNSSGIRDDRWKKALPRIRHGLSISVASCVVGLTATPVVDSVEDLRASINVLRPPDKQIPSNWLDQNGALTAESAQLIHGYLSMYDTTGDIHVFPKIIPPTEFDIQEFIPHIVNSAPIVKSQKKTIKDTTSTATVDNKSIIKLRRNLTAPLLQGGVEFSVPCIPPKICPKADALIPLLSAEGIHLVFCSDNQQGLAVIANMLREGYEQWTMRNFEDISSIKKRFVLFNGRTRATATNKTKDFLATGKQQAAALEWFLGKRPGPQNVSGERVSVALLLTPLFYQGVDFKNVRHIYILDPPNDIRMYAQIIGRVRRYCSHSMLPYDQWTATVHMFFAGTKAYVIKKSRKNKKGDEFHSSKFKRVGMQELSDLQRALVKMKDVHKNFKKQAYARKKRISDVSSSTAANKDSDDDSDNSTNDANSNVDELLTMFQKMSISSKKYSKKKHSKKKHSKKHVKTSRKRKSVTVKQAILVKKQSIRPSNKSIGLFKKYIASVNKASKKSNKEKKVAAAEKSNVPWLKVSERLKNSIAKFKTLEESKTIPLFPIPSLDMAKKIYPNVRAVLDNEHECSADQLAWLNALTNYAPTSLLLSSCARHAVDCVSNEARTGITNCSGSSSEEYSGVATQVFPSFPFYMYPFVRSVLIHFDVNEALDKLHGTPYYVENPTYEARMFLKRVKKYSSERGLGEMAISATGHVVKKFAVGAANKIGKFIGIV